MADLAGRPQRTSMITVSPDAGAPSEEPVHRLRKPDAESLHAAPERVCTLCLDEKVHVVRLHAVVNDPKHLGGGGAEPTAEGWEEARASKRR